MIGPHAQYTENETGNVVDVEYPLCWGYEVPTHVVVRWPSGLVMIVGRDRFDMHFSIVQPQEIQLVSSYEHRPTPKQREVERNGRSHPNP